MNKTKLYWTLQIGGWATYALLQLLIAGLQSELFQLTFRQATFLILEAAVFLLATHLFRNFIIYKGWLEIGMRRLIPRVLAAVVVLAFLVYLGRISISFPIGLFNKEAFNPATIGALVAVYTFIIFLWVLLYFIYHYFERYNLALKHQAAIHEIELNNLKAQLNPHFIFNALNSIRALVEEEPKKSKMAINQLSNILRNALTTDKKRLTHFGEELSMVKDYLGLETIRFEERLNTSFEIDPESYNFQIPPLMLQTLVENGIKHGISRLKKGGIIAINTSVHGGELTIQIRNTGQIKALNGKGYGVRGLGLKNTHQRLRLIYGEDAHFSITNENDETVLTELIIPQKIYYEDTNN